MTDDLFKLLVDRIDAASQRSRWIFSISIVVSMALIASAWNFAAGTLRASTEQLVLKPSKSSAPQAPPPSLQQAAPVAQPMPQDEYLKDLRKEIMKSWVDGLSINISPIGMKLAVMDAGLIGGAALLIISAWLFFSIRRENHLVSKVIEAAQLRNDPEAKSFVFWGVASTQLFNTLSDDDAPFEVNRPPVKNKQHIARTTKTLMAYLPILALATYIAVDLLNIYVLSSIFAGKPEPPIDRIPWLAFRGVFAISIAEMALLVMTWRLITATRLLQRSTRNHLRTLQSAGWDRTFANARAGGRSDA